MLDCSVFCIILDYTRPYQTVPDYNELYSIVLDYTQYVGQCWTIPDHIKLYKNKLGIIRNTRLWWT